jgi:putative oxidoreductase
MDSDRQRRALALVRAAVAANLVIHGLTRLSLGGVNAFGEHLGSQGIPGGPAVAWLLTTVEVLGGLSLLAGYFVPWLCLWFAAELSAGIVMVHFKEGWFVVGAGRNGMEYSVVLIVCLLTVAWAGWRREDAGRA